MKFLAFNKRGRSCTVVVREKTCKYGQVIGTETLDRSVRVIMFTGPHNAGKSRSLKKIYDTAEIFFRNVLQPVHYDTYRGWPTKDREARLSFRDLVTHKSDVDGWVFPKPLFISARSSKTYWLHEISDWWKSNNPGKKWTALSAPEKDDVLISYLKTTHAVLIIDDIHVLSNTTDKTRLVKRMLENAARIVASCDEETRVCQSLRPYLTRSDDSQIIRLTSDDAVSDITQPFVWFLAFIILVASGQGAVAAVIAIAGALRSKMSTRAAR